MFKSQVRVLHVEFLGWGLGGVLLVSKHQPCHCCDIVLFIPRRVASPSRYLEITDGSLEVFDINIQYCRYTSGCFEICQWRFWIPRESDRCQTRESPALPGRGRGKMAAFSMRLSWKCLPPKHVKLIETQSPGCLFWLRFLAPTGWDQAVFAVINTSWRPELIRLWSFLRGGGVKYTRPVDLGEIEGCIELGDWVTDHFCGWWLMNWGKPAGLCQNHRYSPEGREDVTL